MFPFSGIVEVFSAVGVSGPKIHVVIDYLKTNVYLQSFIYYYIDDTIKSRNFLVLIFLINLFSYNCWFLPIFYFTLNYGLSYNGFNFYPASVSAYTSDFDRPSIGVLFSYQLVGYRFFLDLFLFSFIEFCLYSNFNSDPDCRRHTFQTIVCFLINNFYGLFIFASVYIYNGRTRVPRGHENYF